MHSIYLTEAQSSVRIPCQKSCSFQCLVIHERELAFKVLLQIILSKIGRTIRESSDLTIDRSKLIEPDLDRSSIDSRKLLP